MVRRNVVRADGLASFPRQRVGSGSAELGGNLVGDAEGTFSTLAGALAAHVHGGGLGAVTVDGQGDGLGLGQVLLQRNVLLGLVGGGDGASRHEVVGHLVDHGAVVLPRVTYRTRVEDVGLHVVGTVGSVNDGELGVDSRGLRVGLGVGCCGCSRCDEGGACNREAGDEAGGTTTLGHCCSPG